MQTKVEELKRCLWEIKEKEWQKDKKWLCGKEIQALQVWWSDVFIAMRETSSNLSGQVDKESDDD